MICGSLRLPTSQDLRTASGLEINESNVDWLSNSELLASAFGNVQLSVASDLSPTLFQVPKDLADLVTDRLISYSLSDTNHIALHPNPLHSVLLRLALSQVVW